MPKFLTVLKANGQEEPFDEHKIRHSLHKAHVPRHHQEMILERLQQELYNRIPTREIYHHVQQALRTTYPSGAPRYNLKQAIMELGPTGYPFERYVGELLKHNGFEVRVGTIIQGTCVSHEVDVIAEKNNEHYMIECKFHNQYGARSDVKVGLYVQARYLDILNAWKAHEPMGKQNEKHQAWLITNTKCTSDAIQYAQCVGMQIIGWNYPERGNLQELIEAANLHPITSLSSLSFSQKQELLAQDIVLVKSLAEQSAIIESLHLNSDTQQHLRKEFDAILQK